MTIQQPASSDPAPMPLSRGTIFPLVGGRTTWTDGHLLPLFATVLVGVVMFEIPVSWIHFSDKAEINRAWQIYWVLALYIVFLVNYYIYEICARARPWWLVAAVAIFTWDLLGGPIWNLWYSLFYTVLPAAEWKNSSNMLVRLAGWFFGTGLCEEGFKAIPLLGLAVIGAWFGRRGRHATGKRAARFAHLRAHIGLNEPLHGVLLGVASGTGFFVRETLGQYVPGAMKEGHHAGIQAFDGLVLLLARGLPELAEHSAWSGLFGYFIGLAVLRPGMAYFLLPLGWFSAAALHAGWDGISAVSNADIVVLGFDAMVGVLSYALLAGAILKAREISPTLSFSPATTAAKPDTARTAAAAPAAPAS
jgi:RsiW-degrading membrane proteinase PrsW (M82 family)